MRRKVYGWLSLSFLFVWITAASLGASLGKESNITEIVCMTVFFIASVAMIVFFCIYIREGAAARKQNRARRKQTPADGLENCRYCGARTSVNDSVCPACGAHKKL